MIKKEGEEPVEEEQADPGKDAKKGGKDKKAGDEPEDNNPRIISFENDLTESPFQVTEDLALKFENALMNIEIYKFDSEAGADKLVETIWVDLSYFLFPPTGVEKEWTFDKLKSDEINYLKLKITTDKGFLNELIRRKLNPLMVNILAAKDVPAKVDP